MTDVELQYRKSPGLITRALGAIGVGALLQSLGDQELDAPDPKVVWHTERSSALRALAMALAESGRADSSAVRELAAAAGRHPKELRRAAATLRSGGWAEEDLVSCRANRLLVSAATGQPVEPVTQAELAWFARLRALGEVVPEPAALAAAFGELAAEEPELAVLEREVLLVAAGPEFVALDDEERHAVIAGDPSDRLRGIREGTSARIVRTHAAWSVERDHLFAVAGLAVPGAASADG